MSETADKKLTYGEKMAGITFNPGGDENVNLVKKDFAAVIDRVNDLRKEARKEGDLTKIAFYTDAINGLIINQMLAVKAITWQHGSVIG